MRDGKGNWERWFASAHGLLAQQWSRSNQRQQNCTPDGKVEIPRLCGSFLASYITTQTDERFLEKHNTASSFFSSSSLERGDSHSLNQIKLWFSLGAQAICSTIARLVHTHKHTMYKIQAAVDILDWKEAANKEKRKNATKSKKTIWKEINKALFKTLFKVAKASSLCFS